jgi:2-amino-4-hydroxy-6-hydroxymethyldihydropteridine diphosphokinase
MRKRIAYIALGSNLGNKRLNIIKAIWFINRLKQTTLTRVSRFYKIPTIGKPNQPNFVNAVVEIKTSLSVVNLLNEILKIEKRMERVQLCERWEPRVIDLDILLYNQDTYYSSRLIVPHPRMHQRRFVLEPLCDISPNLIHPVFYKSMRILMKELLYENNNKHK